jgi:hypothetical protein
LFKYFWVLDSPGHRHGNIYQVEYDIEDEPDCPLKVSSGHILEAAG